MLENNVATIDNLTIAARLAGPDVTAGRRTVLVQPCRPLLIPMEQIKETAWSWLTSYDFDDGDEMFVPGT